VETLTGDVKTGAAIIKRALEEPVRQIAENAGLEGSVVVAAVKNSPVGVGFNAATEEYVNMIEAGIVDPAKVTRSALQNASSASAMLLNRKAPLEERVEIFARNMGDVNLMIMCLIFILAGAFAATAKAMGTVDATVLIAQHLILNMH
jgi:hypothetical protein